MTTEFPEPRRRRAACGACEKRSQARGRLYQGQGLFHADLHRLPRRRWHRGAVPGAAPGLTLAPPLAGSKRLQADSELVCRIVLHGLEGPNDGGKTYPNTMAGFPFLDDEWLSASSPTPAIPSATKHQPSLPPMLPKCATRLPSGTNPTPSRNCRRRSRRPVSTQFL